MPGITFLNNSSKIKFTELAGSAGARLRREPARHFARADRPSAHRGVHLDAQKVHPVTDSQQKIGR